MPLRPGSQHQARQQLGNRSPRGKEGKGAEKNTFEKIVLKNFPNLMGNTKHLRTSINSA